MVLLTPQLFYNVASTLVWRSVFPQLSQTGSEQQSRSLFSKSRIPTARGPEHFCARPPPPRNLTATNNNGSDSRAFWSEPSLYSDSRRFPSPVSREPVCADPPPPKSFLTVPARNGTRAPASLLPHQVGIEAHRRCVFVVRPSIFRSSSACAEVTLAVCPLHYCALTYTPPWTVTKHVLASASRAPTCTAAVPFFTPHTQHTFLSFPADRCLGTA
jgi:hypothetical protein